MRKTYLGSYEARSKLPGATPARPVKINVQVTEAQGERIKQLFARAARDGKADDRTRIRRGLMRIVGREAIELAEAGGRPGEVRDIRFVIKE